MRSTLLHLVVATMVLACVAIAQDKTATKSAAKKAGSSDAAYVRQALSAGPAAISKDAGVVRIGADGKMQTLRESKNGFTCMVALGSPMCADENSMAFFDAWMKNENPPEKLGITYMLRGDKGASNTDPHATAKTADNHWIVTGPHIMVVGPAAKSMGLTDVPDPDASRPYLMWANTPYAHAMIPLNGGMTHMSKAGMKGSTSEMKGEMKEGMMKCSK